MKRLLTALLIASPALAQTRTLTTEDYGRAERWLGANTTPLVSGTAGRPTWLPDGRFTYRATTAAGAQFWLVDPAKKAKAAAFDHAKLAAAISAAGNRVDADHLPFQAFDFSC